MQLNLKEFNRGEVYNSKAFNLIKKFEADGNLEDFIKLIVKDKPKSPYLEKIKSEFLEIINEEEEKVKPQGRYALVVSINTYNSLGKPEATADGSEAIAKLLETYGKFQVSCQDSVVNQRQLKEALLKIFTPEGKNIPETALFYFSGYGLRETRGVAQSYLAPSDANIDEDKLGISLEWLRKLLEASPVREQIIWLDCCGENLNFDEANPGEQEGKSRCFITASGNFELTKVLQEGLDPTRYQQKEVTNKSLAAYIKEHLQGVTQSASVTNFGEAIALTRATSQVDSFPSTPTTDTGICPKETQKNRDDVRYNAWGKVVTRESSQKVINEMRELRKSIALDKSTIQEMREEGR
jgi:hypothetical protein